MLTRPMLALLQLQHERIVGVKRQRPIFVLTQHTNSIDLHLPISRQLIQQLILDPLLDFLLADSKNGNHPLSWQ